jgi:aminoglycoside/choline kinase family phosphotransferase
VILADHGSPENGKCAADSFFAIGKHLHSRGVPVPRLHGYDRPLGLVALEDLGDLHLQAVIRRTRDSEKVAAHYREVIDLLISMGIEGAKGFDTADTYETADYNEDVVIEREAKYFVTAFLNGYIGLSVDFEDIKGECELLAARALDTKYVGFLHRDFQSRNILVRNQDYYFIDFQGGRLGPLQYDLASLLIDPYVGNARDLQEGLLTYYLKRLGLFVPVDKSSFLRAYDCCAINRNLQILGAFAFLSQVKGKKDFEAYIPAAVMTLKQNIQRLEPHTCKRIRRIVEEL